ncbi:alpha/beta hydrolase family protein [Glaciibacter psychrotolerans]|uniref:KANL3/Tex30 alpha/beta hydrolase-like domain-containing protein n=1 Tax=Glaciibacter psychrotolerans TaxID=670054 RepID=A0A7Z0EDT6_9MICO|nr:alpha/beta family hydrolase [Leifsonia psychrotolerans]NYJ19812.1 hypothetical protein [Leifsonia psychrotolerans]
MHIDVPTPAGSGRLTVAHTLARTAEGTTEQRAVLWLGHGAGGGIDAADLAALAESLPGRGIMVALYEQPWRVAGKKVAPRPAALDAGWLAASALVAEIAAGSPVIVGGRSAGARVACRTADAVGAAAVLCLAFPLAPPRTPEKSRIEELLLPTVPVLVLQGERDPFGAAGDVTAAVAAAGVAAAGLATESGEPDRSIRVVSIPGADHSLAVLKSSPLTADGVANLVINEVRAFIDHVR